MLLHRWQIDMLGGLRLSCDGQSITHFRSRKAALLLAYLAYYAEDHSREQLLDLLWPDDDPEAARNRLRVALSSLRRQIEPPGVEGGSVLAATRLVVALRAEAISTDVAAFDARFAEAVQCEVDDKRIPILIEAVSRYGGDLLPDFYDDWVATERRRLGHSFQLALRRLTRSLAAVRDFETALVYADRAVQNDPLNEEAHRDLMRLHDALDRPETALRQYRELQELLSAEVHASPSQQTVQLATRIASRIGRDPDAQPARFVFRPGSPDPAEGRAVAPADRPRGVSPPSATMSAPVMDRSAALPAPLTHFFGREAELAAIEALLTPGPVSGAAASRIVTLTGIGGAGKTRLAVEAAQRLRTAYDGRVWFAGLADLQEPALLPAAVLEALRLSHGREDDPFGRIVGCLEGRNGLLVLDNLEHLAEPAAEFIGRLLARLPLLSCLATSRRSLGIPGDRDVPILPLPVPEPPPHRQEDGGNGYSLRRSAPVSVQDVRALSTVPSVQLFVDRAQAALPDFQLTARNASDIAVLCNALEGIPLAIELAAARARVLTPGQIVAGLPLRDDLLVNKRAGKDARHRSLRSAIEWSLLLLGPELRRVFVALGVFRGGWTLEAAEAVCPDSDALDALEQLRIDSLVIAEDAGGEMRFRLLETLRQFAASLLTGDNLSATRARHAGYFRGFVERAAPLLKGPSQAEWIDRVEREQDNIRAAFAFLREDSEGAESGLAMVSGLWRFWIVRGSLAEARSITERVLNHPGAPKCGMRYIDGLNVAGVIAAAQDDYAAARALQSRAIALSREQSYWNGLAMALGNAGTVEVRAGDPATASALLEESLELHRQLGNEIMIATTLGHLALAFHKQQQAAKARALYTESIELHRRLGDQVQVASVLGNLGMLAEEEGDYPSAESLHRQSLEIHRALGNRSGIAMAVGNLGILAGRRGDVATGRACFTEALVTFRELDMSRAVGIALDNLGGLEELAGDLAEARRLYEENLAIQRRLNLPQGITEALAAIERVSK